MTMMPALVLLSSLSRYLSLQHGVEDTLDLLSYVLPEQSESTIGDLVRIIGVRSVGLFSIGFFLTAGLASAALNGIIKSVDTAYGTAKARAAWMTWLICFGLTTVIGPLCVLTIHLMAFGPVIEGLAFRPLLKWSLATLLVFVAFEMLYVLAPSGPLSGRLTVPGAVVATAIWLVISWAPGFYHHHFAALHLTSLFGLLANPIAFMIWLYWSAAAILIGAEINSSLADRQGSSAAMSRTG
jgi:membrane protein